MAHTDALRAPGWLTPGEVAKALGCSRATVYWRISQGKLPFPVFRDGAKHSRVRVRRADVLAYVARNTTPAAETTALALPLRRGGARRGGAR